MSLKSEMARIAGDARETIAAENAARAEVERERERACITRALGYLCEYFQSHEVAYACRVVGVHDERESVDFLLELKGNEIEFRVGFGRGDYNFIARAAVRHIDQKFSLPEAIVWCDEHPRPWYEGRDST